MKAVSLAGSLLVLAMLMLALVAMPISSPRKAPSPSRLEKTCFHKGAWLPCFIKDEALSTTWEI